MPTGPPEDVRAVNASSTALNVTWSNVVGMERNGIITGFKVYYKAVGTFAVNRAVTVKEIVGESTRGAVLTDLEKYIEYSIWVLAFTSKGDGPNSTDVNATTDQDGMNTFSFSCLFLYTESMLF